MFALAVVPAGGEAHQRMLRLPAEYLAFLDFQAQPGTGHAPVAHRLQVQSGLLGRQRGRLQVIDQAKHIGAVARSHQQLRAGRRLAGMEAAAAVGQRIRAATRAVACLCRFDVVHSFIDNYQPLWIARCARLRPDRNLLVAKRVVNEECHELFMFQTATSLAPRCVGLGRYGDEQAGLPVLVAVHGVGCSQPSRDPR